MTLVDYKVYRQEVLNFLQSCTIKFDLFAENALIELEKKPHVWASSLLNYKRRI